MKLRVTTISKFESMGLPCICGRIEIRWLDDSPAWTNLGAQSYDEIEWYLLMSLIMLGARRAGIEMEHVNLVPVPVLAQRGCDPLPDRYESVVYPADYEIKE